MRHLQRWILHAYRQPLPKKAWGQGLWQNEPDVVEFQHAGLHCVVTRHMTVTGALCGYVVVPPAHPWWGKDRRECTAMPQCPLEEPIDWTALPGFPVPPQGSRMRHMMDERYWNCEHTPAAILDAHGGITWGDPLHVPPDWREIGWAFGFDCGHAGDLCPLSDATLESISSEGRALVQRRRSIDGPFREVYRDLPYVRLEVERLAEQLALIKDLATAHART